MNARESSSAAPASAGLPSSNPGLTSPLDLPAARRLRDGLRSLLGAERSAAAEFLLALADFDARRGWEPLGHASLFAFLRAELGLSNAASYWRMSAARLLQGFPSVIGPLRDGSLCLSTVAELAKVLTAENAASVLPRFFGLSAREAKEVVADLQPRQAPPTRTLVTGLDFRAAPSRAEAAVPLLLAVAAPEQVAHPDGVPLTQLRTPEVELGGGPRAVVLRDDFEPLSGDLRRLHVTVSARLLKKIAAARDGLSHSTPSATIEQVLERALDLLLEQQARARGQVRKPRKTRGAAQAIAPIAASPPRHRRAGPRAAIPAAVKREVWARDGGRCGWPIDGGGTCGSTHRLQLDHVVPWARGGDDSADNLRIVCAAHNTAASRAAFGQGIAARYARPYGGGGTSASRGAPMLR